MVTFINYLKVKKKIRLHITDKDFNNIGLIKLFPRKSQIYFLSNIEKGRNVTKGCNQFNKMSVYERWWSKLSQFMYYEFRPLFSLSSCKYTKL